MGLTPKEDNEIDMSSVQLNFYPREILKNFVNTKENVCVLQRIEGKKSSRNMVIFGDNLSSLAAMKAGAGTAEQQISIDVIYIDPPYNVGGNQGYKNTWKGKSENERDWAFDHGAFLDFMEPRLKIGRTLLSEDGVIFISICDGEFASLKILMNQIFGESNELATFVWNKGRAAAGSHAAATHEFVICFAKNKLKAPPLRQEKPGAQMMIKKSREFLKDHPFEKAQKLFKQWVQNQKNEGKLMPGEAAYNTIHPDNNRLFHADNSCAHDDPSGKRCRKMLVHPITKKPCPVPKNGWKWKESTLNNLVKNGKIWFGKDHSKVPKIIRYLDEQMDQLPLTVIFDGSDGKKDLPPGITFTTPKPVSFIKRLLSFYPKKNAVVLDYFAGSGTTAEATKRLNDEDMGNRSWIMIEEMGSTFNKVLIPRINHFDSSKDYTVFNLQTATIKNNQLLKLFQKYSFDFFSAYHHLNEKNSITVEGMYIVGHEEATSTIIAITIPPARKDRHFFEIELATLKKAIKNNQAKKALIYAINLGREDEEPWFGIDKSILANTTYKNFKVVEIPDELIKEWKNVLIGLTT